MLETKEAARAASMTVLLVDDDEDDIWLVERQFRKSVPGGQRLNVVAKLGATAALEWIGEAQAAGGPLPDLIVLDINMPGLSGLELLAVLRARPVLLATPILMLTTSNDEDLAEQARRAGANAVLTKPDTMDKLEDLIRDVRDTWLCLPVSGTARAQRQATG
ncbi:response regulator [Stappia stellulata]|uniref:response regulator n=1 Tax=Stappia stellulata TaxID=71235 RepID=UPI001CD3806F|nr:response regulator [Stappia stellulata]MCA1242486.1 response regulator [Stappia stellulata]